jgi:hypothetical protein
MAQTSSALPRNLRSYFAFLSMVALCRKRGDRVLFIMSIDPLFRSKLGRSAECYAHAVLPKYGRHDVSLLE